MGSLTRVLLALIVCLLWTGFCAAEGKIAVTTSSEEARQLFLQARDLQDKFLFNESRPLLEEAVKKDENFALAYRDLAFSQPTTKQFLECLAKAVSVVDKVSECERVWVLADEAGAQTDFHKQREYLGKLAGLCDKDERAHYVLGIFFWARQYYDSAAAEMQRTVELSPNFLPAWNMLGYIRRTLNDFAGAEAAFLKYIELNPQDANPYDSYAEMLLKQGRYEESITQYRRALAVDSTFNSSRYGIATNQVYMGKHQLAHEELAGMRTHARNDGDKQFSFFGVAMVYLDEGKYEDALAALLQNRGRAEANHDTAQLAANSATIGLLQLEFGRNDEAIASFRQSAEITQGSTLSPTLKASTERNARYGEARALLQKGELDKAKSLVASFTQSVQVVGNANELRQMHELNGIMALGQKDYRKAIDELLQSNLQTADNLYRLALAYQGLGENEKALEKITAAVNINSLLNLADISVRQKSLALLKEWSK